MEANKKFAKILAAECHKKFGFDIQLLDVRKKCDYCNHFLIVSGRNRAHIEALKDDVKDFSKEKDVKIFGVDGKPDSGWIIVDLGSILVHIFHPETRKFYNLTGLWEKPKLVELDFDESED